MACGAEMILVKVMEDVTMPVSVSAPRPYARNAMRPNNGLSSTSPTSNEARLLEASVCCAASTFRNLIQMAKNCVRLAREQNSRP